MGKLEKLKLFSHKKSSNAKFRILEAADGNDESDGDFFEEVKEFYLDIPVEMSIVGASTPKKKSRILIKTGVIWGTQVYRAMKRK